jgi:AcrR family transcriptional regulator
MADQHAGWSRRTAPRRDEIRRRVVVAARVSLAAGGGVDQRLVTDVCEAVGIRPNAFRQLFATDDELFDAVHASLVEETAQRLRARVDEFVPGDPSTVFEDAARALAEAWPLERGGVTIRAERRARALAGRVDGAALLAAERQFTRELHAILDDLIHLLGRRFEPSASLAVRVVLDTFERSFEAWVLEGHPDSGFPESPYVRRTLPTLLERLSVPGG